MSKAYWCEHAWTGAGEVIDGLVVRVDGSRISDTEVAKSAPDGAVALAGLTIPGFANCHSHAFHRALRGRTQRDRGTFWTWREQMYDVAKNLDPDRYYELARATYAEMLLGGITSVGEFHYLHHDPTGARYADWNAMGVALISAARDVGMRIAMLDTCYLSSGFGRPPEGVQVRFSDKTADAWLDRRNDLLVHADDHVVIGSALHSVRAVPTEALEIIAKADLDGPQHIHLSEQVAENDACREIHGRTPTELLSDHGLLGPRLSAVHATHLTDEDVALLGSARSYACFCPTTERDLADGVGPSRELAAAGSELTLGSDSHAVIDPFEEMRAVELDERLVSHRRGHWSAAELLRAGGRSGHRSLGFGDGGLIEPGRWADLVTLNVDNVRLAGAATLEAVVFAATSSDVTSVVSGGKVLDMDAAEVAADLQRSIAAVTS